MVLFIVIAVVVVAVAALVVLVVRGVRNRSERDDWLGELSEIRRDSLGDDEEVTGALEAVVVEAGEPVELGERVESGESGIDSADPVDVLAEREGAEREVAEGEVAVGETAEEPFGQLDEKPGEVPDVVPNHAEAVAPIVATGAPARTITDAGTLFDEYDWPGFATLRVDVTEPRGIRVILDLHLGTETGQMAQESLEVATGAPGGEIPGEVMVDLPRGVLWFHPEQPDSDATCSVRIPGGWVRTRGSTAVLISEDWCFVMCVSGTASIRPAVVGEDGVDRVALAGGQLARLGVGDLAGCDVVDVGVDVLESDGVIRRQRRLDASATDAHR